MERHTLEKLRSLGLTRKTSSGRECVRVSTQWRQPLEGKPPAERRKALETWAQDVGRKIARHGGEILPDSMSVSALTIEAIVPVDALDEVEAELAGEDARLDVVMPRQIVQ